MNMQAYSAHRTREVAEALAARTNEQRANLAVALVNHLSLLSALESMVKGIEIDAPLNPNALMPLTAPSRSWVVKAL